MKTLQLLRILCIIGLVTIMANSTSAENLVRVPFKATYRVQPGDTMIGIAGSAFMDIYNYNLNRLKQYDLSGDANPNRLVEGMPLSIPKGTYVTTKTAYLINAQRDVREKAQLALEKALASAELLRQESPDGRRSEKGDGLLSQAYDAMNQKNLGGSANYFLAYELAVEAERYFDTKRALNQTRSELNSEIASLKNAATEMKRNITSDIERLDRTTHDLRDRILRTFNKGTGAYWLAFTIATFVLVGFLWMNATKKKQEKQRIQKIIDHHKAKLLAFENNTG